MGNTIYASFADTDLAEKAVGALLDNHVRPEDISVVTGRQETQYHTEYAETGAAVTTRETVDHPGTHIEEAAKGGLSTTTAADAGAGAVKGVGWGVGLGVVAAIASLAIPGFGIVLGGGALAAALGGVAASAGAGAVAGGVTGYLKDQGMNEQLAETYEKNLISGGALVTVTNNSGQIEDITIYEILQKYGAVGTDLYSTAYMA